MSQSPPPAPAAAAGKSALELAREKLACLTEKHKFTEAKLNAAIKERELRLDKLLEQDFKVGERLKARFQTGNPKSFYDCELVAINPNGTFKVKYTEKRRDSDEKGPTVNEVCEQLPCARKSVNPPKGSSYPRFSWIKRGNAKRGRKSNKSALDRLMGELKELRNGDMPRLVERKRQEAESKERRNLEKQIKQMSHVATTFCSRCCVISERDGESRRVISRPFAPRSTGNSCPNGSTALSSYSITSSSSSNGWAWLRLRSRS